MIFLAMAAPAMAGGPPIAVFSKQTKVTKTLPYRATGVWGVATHGQPVAVQFRAVPFERDGHHHHSANTNISLSQRGQSGAINSSVITRQAKTNTTQNQNDAIVSGTVTGSGVSYFRITVEIDKENCPAGNYTTQVDVTLSAP